MNSTGSISPYDERIQAWPIAASIQEKVWNGDQTRICDGKCGNVGHVMLTGGRWSTIQIVEPEYATAARQSDGEVVTGGAIGVPYGFQWWVTDATGKDAFFALGFGGQYVYVVPSRDLVVVVAAGFPDGTPPDLTSHVPKAEQIVIPAVVDP